MCSRVMIENGGMLGIIPDCYKDKKCVIKQLIIILTLWDLSLIAIRLTKCNKAVGTYPSGIRFVPDL